MSNYNGKQYGRRTVFRWGLAGLAGLVAPGTALAQNSSSNPQNRSNRGEPRYNDPLGLELRNGRIHPQNLPKRDSARVTPSREPPGPEWERGSIENIWSAIDSLNRAADKGDLSFYENEHGVVVANPTTRVQTHGGVSTKSSHDCGKNDWEHHLEADRNLYEFWFDDETTEELVHHFEVGGLAAAGVSILLGLRGGPFAAAPSAILALVLAYYAEDLSHHNEGCGVKINVSFYHTNPSVPFYNIHPQ